MVAYKNVSIFARSINGVTFAPGEVKEVPFEINHPKFVKVATPPAKAEAPAPAAEETTVDAVTEVLAPSEPEKETPKAEKPAKPKTKKAKESKPAEVEPAPAEAAPAKSEGSEK